MILISKDQEVIKVTPEHRDRKDHKDHKDLRVLIRGQVQAQVQELQPSRDPTILK